MRQCKCGSYAIHLNQNGRDDSHPELCDVCVWKKDAERYRWLRDNAGAWEVSRDPSEWTRVESGEKFRPGVYFTAYSTGYGGRCLDDAIDAAMAGANT